MGRSLIIAGILIAVIGVLVMVSERLPYGPGRLPGDFTWRGKNTTVFFPLASSIAASLLLTFFFWLFGRR